MKLIALFGVVVINWLMAFGHNHLFSSFYQKDSIEFKSNKNNFENDLPTVFTKNRSDLIERKLKHEAAIKYALLQFPKTKKEWFAYKDLLKEQLIKKAGIKLFDDLPFDFRETGVRKIEGVTIKNIIFQTRPGVYATANLFIPDGEGPFPAVLNSHGHWGKGRLNPSVISRGITLALNGYVCLNMDAFGSGERTTFHGVDEYHGANLGGSLINIGESLMGFQVSDNVRGVGLLASLSYVDADKIGATGASGGGNQTMWLTAIDERIRASVPVVSVGTFESAVMRRNCVCELLIDGLTIAETSDILAMAAPRSIMSCNHIKDSNPTFYPTEMLRSYHNAKSVYEMLGNGKNISYKLFDLKHGYFKEDREAMLGWFDFYLRGIGKGEPKKEKTLLKTLPVEEQLMVYKKGKRNPKVESISAYCKRKGIELRTAYLKSKNFDTDKKKKELKNILRINESSVLKSIHRLDKIEGWNRFGLETSDKKLIPVLLKPPRDKSMGYVIVSRTLGKKYVSTILLDKFIEEGLGVVLVDLSGTGEARSIVGERSKVPLHTIARSELWLGRTVLGEWIKELEIVVQFLTSEFEASKIRIDGKKEAGLAALFLTALKRSKVNNVVLRNAPVSYLFASRKSVDYFSMGIHLPRFLKWGDLSLASAFSGIDITFTDPVNMSGQSMNENELNEYRIEFERMRTNSGFSGNTVFN